MKRTNAGRSIFITLLAQIVLYGQGLIVMPITIKLAGESVYGTYILILNIFTTAYALSNLGAGYNFRRKLASAYDPDQRRILFEPQFTFQSMNLALLSAALLVGGTAVQHVLFGPGKHLSNWIIPVWFACYLLYSQVADYFRYSLRFVHFNVIGMYPLLFIALVALYALLFHDMGLDVLMLLQAAAYGVVSLPLLVLMLRETGRFKLRLPWKLLRDDIAIGYPMTLEFLTDLLIGYADRYIILLYLTVADVGRYQPAYQLGALSVFFPKVAGVVLAPMLGNYVDHGERDRANDLVRNFLRLFLMVAIPFAVGVALLAPSLVALLANRDVAEASRWVGGPIAIATIFNGIGLVGFQIGFVLGRTKTVLNANVVGAATNICLNLLVLYMVRDITVPAIVSMLSYMASCAYIVFALRRLWPITISAAALLRFTGAAAVMAVVLALLGYRPGVVLQVSVIAIVGHILLGIITYAVALVAVGGLHRGDLQQFRAIFRREAKMAEGDA